MNSLLLILVVGVILGLVLVFKQQPGKGGGRDERPADEGSEEE